MPDTRRPASRRLQRALQALGAGALSAALLLAAAPAASAADTEVDGLTYSLAAGTATVTGQTVQTSDVTIPRQITVDGDSYTVTAVGDSAFDRTGGTALTSLSLPDSLTDIGFAAFQGNALTSLTLPASVRTVGDQAFALNAIRSVTFHEGLASIGSFAFSQSRLERVTLPSTVTDLGFAPFGDNPLSVIELLGPPPTTFGTIATTPPATALYPWRFGEARFAGGYTEPAWNDLPTTAVATVAFDSAGGSAVTAQSVVLESGATATRPADPARDGFTFDGWRRGDAAYDFATPLTGDLTLTAQWALAPEPSPTPTPEPTPSASSSAAPAPPSTPAAAELAATGIDPLPFTLAALGLLGAGAVAFVAERRARRRG
ncbi:putative repeat protein (TIGR02543 family) [Microbacterium sp. SORGH_AS428]|uniref:leucine-rich repeat protein n=1 Tax=Microbacterium sp. SORGH_AS_0428 TaxID=3041788 RepID=UPI0028587536|nr:leucine-rich repeat protein [Microbacterium sp. SORGH_AS_0428]MDR6199694.1 putative repeat protein (TIGR02543 family) [Microbacterium sp. SORGH_AS_0428]